MTPDQYRREGFRLGIEAVANEGKHVKVEGRIAIAALFAYEARIRAIDVDEVLAGMPTVPVPVARLVEAAMHLLSEYDAPNPVDDAVSKLRTALVACKEARDD